VPRETLETYPPFFLKDLPSGTDIPLVWLIRSILGLDEIAFACFVPRFANDFQARFWSCLKFETRADNGRVLDSHISCQPLLRREAGSLRPLFSRDNLL